MLYAIAMGQIIIHKFLYRHKVVTSEAEEK